jgi:hypothetical protein
MIRETRERKLTGKSGLRKKRAQPKGWVFFEGKRISAGIYEVLPKHFSYLWRVISSFRFTPSEITPL